MATVKVPPGQLGAVLRDAHKKIPKAVRAGLSIAAERGRAHLVARVPTYKGVLRNAWEVRSHLAGPVAAEVTNSAPYAGIVERGARPHWTSEEGKAALREWVRLKLFRPGGRTRAVTPRQAGAGGKYEREIDRIVEAIVHHWAKVGRKGGFHVRDALPTLGRWATAEVVEQLNRFLAGLGGTP